nr:transposase [Myxococcus vastator]
MLGEGRHLPQGAARAGQRPEGARRLRPGRWLRGRVLLGHEKRGPCVGKPKRGKETKVVAAIDSTGLPVSIGIASASPHAVKVIKAAFDEGLLDELPERPIGGKAYDSDKLDERLGDERGVKLIAPHRRGREREATQDGRELRRYKRRWKVERFFAWLHFFRRLVTRHEVKTENFLGFLHFACAIILLRPF